jgi:exodeoxyribonuclease V gamma subunit
MPPLHLGLLQALGQCVDVQLYALNPCREYWLEVTDRRRLAYLAARAAPGEELHHEEGNRLLAAWGKQTKAQLELLIAATGDAVIDEAHFDEPGVDPEREPESASLLARVQRSMLDLTELAPGSVALAEGDRSIEVHVCHGLARELEVLHDRLLALFAAPQPPAPSDILVVTPDLEAAAPLIDAIFGTAPAERRIPFHVTGRGRSSVNPVARALLDLLALAGSRFAASAVFGLLQQPIVARRFGLAAEDLAQVHAWLEDAGVHWALDAGHRASFGLPAQARYSFADGLDRLYLGYALPARIDAPFGARLPAGDAEGSDAVALGALWRFVGLLAALHRRVAAPLAATDWTTLLTELLHDFLAPQGEEVEDLRETQAAIERFADELQRATPEQRLPLDVLRSALTAALDDAARGGVPTGAVTFAAINSLRNLPCKVVCAIGLNDGAFPTQARPAEYDLMARDARPGDRQRRVDERNLFLDLLLAAREHFYLSYTGRSLRDNAPLPPSTLVSELLDTLLPAIAGNRDAARARLVVQHPLQGFADIGFRADVDPRLRSFDSDIAAALRQRTTETPEFPPRATQFDEEDDESAAPEALPAFFPTPLAPPGDEWCDVALADLITFFGNPCRYLLGRRLGIALAKAEEELQDDEPFIAGIPARSALATRLLPALCAGHSVDGVRALALAGSEVPAGAFGRHFLERELAGLGRFALHLNALTAAPVCAPHASHVESTHAGRSWRVHGGFADLRASGLVRHRYDDVRARDLIDAWLHHLLLCADPPPGVALRTTWLARDACVVLDRCATARETLHALVSLYARGLQEPLYFFPKTAWAYMENGESIAKAVSTWQVSNRHPFGESADPAYRLALRGLPDPMGEGWDDFEACARAVFAPLRAHIEGSQP